MASNTIEAVGSGVVSATINQPENCQVTLALNGIETDSIAVEDGDEITVEIHTESKCKCCETKRDCSPNSSGFIAQARSGKISINKNELARRIRFIAERSISRN
jgi:hypothetical protein